MRKYLFVAILVIIAAGFFGACNYSNLAGRQYKRIGVSTMAQQEFEIDITKNVTLKTRQGCIINIPAGALQSNQRNVKLIITEALSMSDMAMARLTTTSGNKTLSSGGMLYLNVADGYKVAIKRPLTAYVPTVKYNPDMKVFKGVMNSDSMIDWQSPKPLPDDSLQRMVDSGKALFQSNCASCHKIVGDFTGSALLGVTYRRPRKWLHDFITGRNRMGKEMLDPYIMCLYKKWAPTVMTYFPQLSSKEIDGICAYIKAETDRIQPEYASNIPKNCCDSCEAYSKGLVQFFDGSFVSKQEDDFFEFRNQPNFDTYISPTTTLPENGLAEKDYVTPLNNVATYYTISIESFGWANIDIFMKDMPRCVESELFVRLKGNKNLDCNVALLVPAYKANREGGKAQDGLYAFDESNGKVTLPMGANCIVVSYAEDGDKILFGRASFVLALKQTIEVEMSVVSRKQALALFKGLDIEGAKLSIERVKTEVGKNEAPNKLDSLRRLNPKNCDCGLNTAPK